MTDLKGVHLAFIDHREPGVRFLFSVMIIMGCMAGSASPLGASEWMEMLGESSGLERSVPEEAASVAAEPSGSSSPDSSTDGRSEESAPAVSRSDLTLMPASLAAADQMREQITHTVERAQVPQLSLMAQAPEPLTVPIPILIPLPSPAREAPIAYATAPDPIIVPAVAATPERP